MIVQLSPLPFVFQAPPPPLIISAVIRRPSTLSPFVVLPLAVMFSLDLKLGFKDYGDLRIMGISFTSRFYNLGIWLFFVHCLLLFYSFFL
ncbi:hypothetical protein TorRG33x02_196940 [Trema orientale]|uniref:Transmembrane protein n=1 Tax=Trema orientale TaxID=63057 RepID=A0A2P5EG20_TREOI|nr:hypothetical protein TorRG33x02_196940 [Trema orientale]